MGSYINSIKNKILPNQETATEGSFFSVGKLREKIKNIFFGTEDFEVNENGTISTKMYPAEVINLSEQKESAPKIPKFIENLLSQMTKRKPSKLEKFIGGNIEFEDNSALFAEKIFKKYGENFVEKYENIILQINEYKYDQLADPFIQDRVWMLLAELKNIYIRETNRNPEEEAYLAEQAKKKRRKHIVGAVLMALGAGTTNLGAYTNSNDTHAPTSSPDLNNFSPSPDSHNFVVTNSDTTNIKIEKIYTLLSSDNEKIEKIAQILASSDQENIAQEDLKIEEIYNVLSSDDKKIEEIADLVGYKDTLATETETGTPIAETTDSTTVVTKDEGLLPEKTLAPTFVFSGNHDKDNPGTLKGSVWRKYQGEGLAHYFNYAQTSGKLTTAEIKDLVKNIDDDSNLEARRIKAIVEIVSNRFHSGMTSDLNEEIEQMINTDNAKELALIERVQNSIWSSSSGGLDENGTGNWFASKRFSLDK